ncbi:hypothetical protein E1J21_12565 [Xanthomonas hortorum pv. vitians]|nr:hypothetical protein [Xanthomonas hortorum pv. vitians]
MIQTASPLLCLRTALLLAIAALAGPSLIATASATTSASHTLALAAVPASPVIPALPAPAASPVAPTAIAPTAPLAPVAPVAPVAPSAPSAPSAAAPVAPRARANAPCGKATATNQDEGDAYVLVHGEHQVMHGSRSDLQTARAYTGNGQRVLWFRADGVQYLVRNPTLMHRLSAAHVRSQQLADAQATLAARQHALSERQAALAAQLSAQTEPRALQASTRMPSAAASASSQQGAMPEALQALAREQRALADRQAALATKQAGASKLATREALKVPREALDRGLVTRVSG